MFKEGILDKILYEIKKLIPRRIFSFFQPVYHTLLAYAGAVVYGFPSRSMKVIGVTGTKGKSTTIFLISQILENAGHPVAAIGSLGFKIKDKEWPNTLKMTMPGRFKLQKFLAEAKKAGCQYVVLEVTSEGLKQKRHLGIKFDCAVFTNLHKEHLERHGSFESYRAAKQELFKSTKNIHVINADDSNAEYFGNFSSKHKIFYGLKTGDIRAGNIKANGDHATFSVYSTEFSIHLGGQFNILNCLAALATCAMYGIDLPTAKPVLENIETIPGRMQFMQKEPFGVVVDYAHTPDSLQNVYYTLKPADDRLICVLGAAGGGRDKWKRPEFGKIADEFCDEIILTNEDPYDEMPEKIIGDIESGILVESQKLKVFKVLDRKEAIKKAIGDAQSGDIVVITGKGSETTMAIAHGKKIPWSDEEVVKESLK